MSDSESDPGNAGLEAFSHARSIHCRLILHDWHPHNGPTDRKPHRDFILPNDRGALIGPGTFRLPLDRHRCAETLWRFFGDMGEPDDSKVVTAVRLAVQKESVKEIRGRAFAKLEQYTRKLLDQPSFEASEDFGNTYCLFLYILVKEKVLHFAEIIFDLYRLLSENHPTRPSFMDRRAWDEELKLKRASRWVMRPDEQYLGAEVNMVMGDRFLEKGSVDQAAWCYLRAVLDMCPWVPTSWFITPDVAEPMPEFSIIFHCLNRLAYYAWTIGTTEADMLSSITASFVLENDFSTRGAKVQAGRFFSVVGRFIRHNNFDRTASWAEFVAVPDDADGTSVEDINKPRSVDISYEEPVFSPMDVVFWARNRWDLCGIPSSAWDFPRATPDAIAVAALAAWRRTYGMNKAPFTWDGTEEEALGEELGEEPRAALHSIYRLVLQSYLD